MTIRPAETGMRPDVIISDVLLPQPDGPMIETNSPAPSSNETPSTAFKPRLRAR